MLSCRAGGAAEPWQEFSFEVAVVDLPNGAANKGMIGVCIVSTKTENGVAEPTLIMFGSADESHCPSTVPLVRLSSLEQPSTASVCVAACHPGNPPDGS